MPRLFTALLCAWAAACGPVVSPTTSPARDSFRGHEYWWQYTPEEVGALSAACERGIAERCAQLGVVRDELGPVWDREAACRAHRLACKDRIASACRAAGVCDLQQREHARGRPFSARELEKACNARQAGACYELGARTGYRTGATQGEGPKSGNIRTEKIPATDLDIQCSDGDHEACTELAILHRSGFGVDRAPKRARLLLTAACDGGYFAACVVLAGAKLDEEQPDERGAKRLLKRACRGGDAVGCGVLGRLALKDMTVLPELRDTAAEQLARACRWGDVESCSDAATLACKSRLATCSPAAANSAVELLNIGCNRNDGASCGVLAHFYRTGRGVAPSLGKAKQLAERGCSFGFAAGCGHLGQIYLKGEGVTPDAARGRKLHGEACDMGFAPSCQLAPGKEP